MSQPLRVIGTPDTLLPEILERAQSDLGFDVSFEPLDGLEVQQRAVLSPESFDVLDHWSISAELAWMANALQPIVTDRILECDKLLGSNENSTFWKAIRAGEGHAPGRRLFIQSDGALGSKRTDRLVMVPTVHNMDSFGHVADAVVPEPSWGALLDPEFRGAVALTDHAPIAMIDCALATQAKGLATYKDIGNLRVEEIDALIDIMIDLKRRGQFAGLWSGTDRIVELVQGEELALSTIWAQGIMRLRALGVSIVNVTPKEGYRGWLDGLAISRVTQGDMLSRAYAFANWWQSGWPGAVMARTGIYTTRPDRVREHLTVAEWHFWYEGGPASEDIRDNRGLTVFSKGDVRDGGGYAERLGNVAVWNTFMDEHNYLCRKWQEFISA